MSSVFEAVKRMVSVTVAAEDCSLEVNSAGMVRCPFHEDHTPSMKLYMDHFYCFGCGKHGDVIDLIAGLAGITPYEAALNLAEAYHVDVENLPDQRPVDLAAKAELKRFQEDQLRCQRILCEYLRLLAGWKQRYAPPEPYAEPDDRFVEACQMIDTIDYLTDLLIVGTLEQRVKAVDLLLADGKIDQLEERLNRIKEEEQHFAN